MNSFGHICRVSDVRLVKPVLFGIMKGTKWRGKLRRRWSDDVTEKCNSDRRTLNEPTKDK